MSQAEYYGIDCLGQFWLERVSSLPTWTSADEGRGVYDYNTGQAYYGDNTGWKSFSTLNPYTFDLYLWYPEILTSTGKMTITPAVGQIFVANGSSFLMRSSQFLTTDFSSAQRLFTTQANKTYHLRFVYDVGVSGKNISAAFYTAKGISNNQFYLVQTGDVAYNPSALAETNSFFDTKYDDMLIAKVVTNSANAPTVTGLINKSRLWTSALMAENIQCITGRPWQDLRTYTIDWARTPLVYEVWTSCGRIFSTTEVALGSDNPYTTELQVFGFHMTNETRYSFKIQFMFDRKNPDGGSPGHIEGYYMLQADN